MGWGGCLAPGSIPAPSTLFRKAALGGMAVPEGGCAAEVQEPGTCMQGDAPSSQVVTEGKEEEVVATLPGPRG